MGKGGVQKKAIRESYLKELERELEVELEKNASKSKPPKSQTLRNIKFDEMGKMLYIPIDPQFAPPFVERFQESLVLINYLAGKLVDTKTELFLLQQKTE